MRASPFEIRRFNELAFNFFESVYSGMNNHPRYREAYFLAGEAHSGQTIPGTNVPYIVHCALVVAEVQFALPHSPDVDADLAILCAILHDTVEDTVITKEQIGHRFGQPVANGVEALTKNPLLEKKHRMRDSLARILLQPKEVAMVKMADRITNLATPPPHWSPAKIAGYRDEAHVILDALGDSDRYLAEKLKIRISLYG